MTKNNKNTNQKATSKEQATPSDRSSYEEVKSHFIQEASSLIPNSMIEQTLSDEKRKFQNAEILHIPAKKIIGSNSLRYCKDLLRKKQPFYGFYVVLNFLTELSILHFFLGLLICIVEFAVRNNDSKIWSNSFEFLYGLIIIGGLWLYKTLSTASLRKVLQTTISLEHASDAEISKIKKRITINHIIIFFATMIICGILLITLAYSGFSSQYRVTLFELFMGYVICIFLSGIHNTIYSSHLIPFFSIGGFLLTKRPAEEIKYVSDQYMELSFLQILSNKGKTLEELKQNAELEKDVKASLRSRLVTQRVYYALAIFILILLAGVCLYQMSIAASAALLLFFAIIIIAAACLLTAFISANYVIRKLPKTLL